MASCYFISRTGKLVVVTNIHMCAISIPTSIIIYIVLYLLNDLIHSDSIDQLHMLEGRCHTISVPLKISSLHMASRYDWLLTESETDK